MFPGEPALASLGNDVLFRAYTVAAGKNALCPGPEQTGAGVAALAAEKHLDAGEVHLWLIPVSDDRAALAQQWISTTEQAKAEGFSTQGARRQFIVARGFLRLLLAHYTGGTACEIVFGKAPNGKPFLADPNLNQVRFNVSHTEHAIALAFSLDTEIGVDIEQVRPDFAWRDVAEMVFTDTDYRDLAKADGDVANRGFFDLWVRMEAALKLKGDGILQAVQAKRCGSSGSTAMEKRILQVGFDFGDDLTGSLAAAPCRPTERNRLQ